MKLIFTNDKPTATGLFAYKEDEHSHQIEGTIELRDNELWWCSEYGAEPLRQVDGGEWCRLVPAYEVEKAFVEARSCGIGAGYRCGHGIRWPHECKECADLEFTRWQESRARRVATGEEEP